MAAAVAWNQRERVTYAQVFDANEQRLRDVDVLYEICTERSGRTLRAYVKGLHTGLRNHYADLLDDERNRAERQLFEDHFAACLASNHWSERALQLTTLFVNIFYHKSVRAIFCPSGTDARPRVDVRAFQQWEKRYLVPAVEQLHAGTRFDPLSFGRHLAAAYAKLIAADAAEHPCAYVLEQQQQQQTSTAAEPPSGGDKKRSAPAPSGGARKRARQPQGVFVPPPPPPPHTNE